MSAKSLVPMQVLSQALKDAINKRRIRVAVFTTFTFDPGFFELNVLPVLFDQSFSQPDKLRRLQLEDLLDKVDEVAVYYDRSALIQSATPGRLDYRRIDVHRDTGCFHPKVTLLLVDEPPGEDPAVPPGQSLIVMVASANLTQEGWWQNVECAHVEEIRDKDNAESRQAIRRDVLYFLQRIEACSGPDEKHAALDAVRTFLRERAATEAPAYASSGGRYHTRLFYGQGDKSLSQWLSELRLARRSWNLEVISPYFDPTGSGPLAALVEALEPRETRVYLPLDDDGTAQVTKKTYEGVQDLDNCHWAELSPEVQKRSGSKDLLRRVHAKVYRLWNSEGQVLITGSVNLTSSGHIHAGAGNLEAAFLTDATDSGYPLRWWLQTRERRPSDFSAEPPTEKELASEHPIELSIRFDWATESLEYRLDCKEPWFEVGEVSGRSLFKVERPTKGKWAVLAGSAAGDIKNLLVTTSLVKVTHAGGSFHLLLREENMAYRPPVRAEITPEEILQWWSLLTQAQRASFIEERFAEGEQIEGLPIGPKEKAIKERVDTVFDRFAGVYHAFGCLQRSLEEAFKEGRYRDAEARLCGARHDSLPSLLAKLKARANADPVLQYVTFLCARQLRDWIARTQRDFFGTIGARSTDLDQLLAHLEELKAQLAAQDVSAEFLNWYEPSFLRRARV